MGWVGALPTSHSYNLSQLYYPYCDADVRFSAGLGRQLYAIVVWPRSAGGLPSEDE